MKLIIECNKKEEKKAKDLLKDLKQLRRDFGGFPECAKVKIKIV